MNLLKNDKSTYIDELLLIGFVAICVGLGLWLTITSPSFWIISSTITKSFGIIWILAGVMFIPAIIYRLLTNEIRQ